MKTDLHNRDLSFEIEADSELGNGLLGCLSDHDGDGDNNVINVHI